MRNISKTSACIAAILLLVGGAMVYGWVQNAIQLIDSSGGSFTPLFALRVIGLLVIPLGAILGFM